MNNIIQVSSDYIQASNWRVGNIVEDCRYGSPTLGEQFAIIDHEDGEVELRQLDESERVISSEVFSRIK